MAKQKQNTEATSEKPKKPIFKKWWFWAIIVVVAIAIASSSGGGSGDQTDTPASAAVDTTQTAPPEESTEPEVTLKHGELVSVTNSLEGVVVVKAKITSSWTNDLTIDQNYINVADLILNQGFDKYDEIQYWAVADMTNGEEQKVISFTLNRDTIEGVLNGNIVDIELGDYVEDLYIHQSLQ